MKHPCKGMTKPQIEAFERIAINQPPRAAKRTLDILLRRGLIERAPDKIIGVDRLGTVTIPQYFVPLPIHHQWCQWASTQNDA